VYDLSGNDTNMLRGLVFNIQKYSLHDGPGIRTTVFLKGCPLCCAWCHNPEGIAPRPELVVVEGRCKVCGECRKACRFAESIGGEGVLSTRAEPCTLCGDCVAACPTGARQLVGREMLVSEVMAEILKDRIFYEESGGGVTVSGGEPLMQPPFLVALLQACRAQCLHTVLDTTGFGCTEHLLAAARLSNLVLYDLKALDEGRHRQLTGVSNAAILDNLQTLDQVHDNIWIRLPVVPGFNDDEDNLRKTARFVAGLRHVTLVDLLPFHRSGLHKFERLGLTHSLDGVYAPSAIQMEQAASLFRAAGLKVHLGG
jgi:pyruvate formate lyase activating enzyme